MVCAPVRRDNPRALARGLSTEQAHKRLLYLTCTTITSVDLAQYEVSHAKDWLSADCGTTTHWAHNAEPTMNLPINVMMLNQG